jgi:DNA polymerase I
MKDDEWTRELLEGDIHTKNQLAAGLPERNMAKTMIYATLYGAGAAKIGSIVGGGAKEGEQILENFYANTPSA